MVFSSTTFLLAFLPLVAILYYICPRKLRNGLLLVFSLLFYGWGEPKYILIMLFSTVFDYCNGLAIGHFRSRGREGSAKAVLVISVVGNLAILGFFKYTDFAISNLNGLLGTAIPALGLLLLFFAVWFFLRGVVGFADLIIRKGRDWCYEHGEVDA